ncbi:uncharacterized protein [Periplaneta americana]|uniref:uncharacterized protein n=1 Tax=Periplaneta americana TaxID=6978 RepID=UPI0037E83893
MTRNMETSALLFLLFVALLCNSLGHAAYFYNRGTNTGTNPHSKPSGYYSSGLSSQHHINHHKNHQHHNSNNGRLQQAAVGVISRGRLVPYTASTITTTTTPSSRLSPLDRLMNRLDSEEKQSSHHQNHFTRFEQGKRHHELPSYTSHTNRQHGTVSPTFLRSSDNRFAQMRSNADDSYEDDDEDDDDEEEEDVLDDGDNREDEEDEDEDEEDEEEEELNAGRHHHKSQNHHRGGHSTGRDVTWFDGAVADFPDHTSYTSSGGGAVTGSGSGIGSGGGSGSGSGSGSGTDTRFGGYSSYSEFKWNTLNQRNMEILRNQKGTYKTHTSEADINKAVKHALEVNKEGLCRVPKPRLIKVKDVFPHPSKTYFPHCTILHQCGDDTGCCRSDTLTCIARHTELVELYFYTTTMGGSGGSRTRNNPVVEKLEFHNHTECACVDRFEEFMPRDRPSSSSELDNLGKSGFRGYTSRTASGTSESNTCRCTSQFSARHVADGSCVCECFDKQRDCIRSKRGKEFLPHNDRICVLRGECTTPSCEFGSYLRRAGRCPRKREKFETWQQYPLHDEEYK